MSWLPPPPGWTHVHHSKIREGELYEVIVGNPSPPYWDIDRTGELRYVPHIPFYGKKLEKLTAF